MMYYTFSNILVLKSNNGISKLIIYPTLALYNKWFCDNRRTTDMKSESVEMWEWTGLEYKIKNLQEQWWLSWKALGYWSEGWIQILACHIASVGTQQGC